MVCVVALEKSDERGSELDGRDGGSGEGMDAARKVHRSFAALRMTLWPCSVASRLNRFG